MRIEAVVIDAALVASTATVGRLSELRASVAALIGAAVRVVVAGEAAPAVVSVRRVRGAISVAPGAVRVGTGRGTRRLAVDVDGEVAGAHGGAAALIAGLLSTWGITGRLVLVLSSGPRRRGARALVDAAPFARARGMFLATGSGGPRSAATERRAVATLLSVLETVRAERSVPSIDDDPRWVVPLPGALRLRRIAESIGALANGAVGVRAAPEEGGPGSTPRVFVAGFYGADGDLVPCPVWTALDGPTGAGAHGESIVDLRTGVLARRRDDGFVSARFVSAATTHTMAMRAAALAGFDPGDALRPPARAEVAMATHGADVVATVSAERATLAFAAHTEAREQSVDRIVTFATGDRRSARRTALDRLGAAVGEGFDTLLAAHRGGWAARWRDACIDIEGSPEDELAARFATFHLLAAAREEGEAAVGARGLTGDAYLGHVFWDADVYVLPALCAIRPAAARAMLEYRLRRLGAARREAKLRGLRGARFPWESAGSGRDVAPREVVGGHGERIPILTGVYEEHIVADIAWAAEHYAAWTGDAVTSASGAARSLVVETARYWASRVSIDDAGRYHLHAVMGPDEYHEVVDDNAFTNVMARWNLRRGAALLEARGSRSPEASRWRRVADSLVDGWSDAEGVYEQFAGYFTREPLLVADVAAPPVAMDVVLGPSRVTGSQIIKQLDALMLHHLVPGEVRAGSLAASLAYYEPRTAHGSSLSPAISASLHARAGDPDRALVLLRMALRLDLDDLTGTAAGGLHLATMGGVWQALAFGFLGLSARGTALAVDPHLPGAWESLAMRMRFRGRRVSVRATHDDVTIACDRPMRLVVGAGRAVTCRPPGATFGIEGGTP